MKRTPCERTRFRTACRLASRTGAFLGAAILTALLGGCLLSPNQPPVAIINAGPTTGEAPFAIHVDGSLSRDTDGIVTTYRWAFGDGVERTGITVDHVYHVPGTYAVKLTVLDNDGATAIQALTITVAPPNTPPVAEFTVSPTQGSFGEAMVFDASASSDADGAIASYRWSFGDGAQTTGNPVQHTYEAPGTYTVSLTVTDEDGSSTIVSRNVNVTYEGVRTDDGNQVPVARFTASSVTGAIGEEIVFDASASFDTDGSVVAYAWDLDGGATRTGRVITHQYSTAGSYQVTLAVVDDGGATDTASLTVTIGASDSFPSDGAHVRTYSWRYAGSTRTLSIEIPEALYDFAVSQPRNQWPYRDYDEYVLDPRDDALMIQIAGALSLGDYYSTVENALAFVQKIVIYTSDAGFFEYPRYPVESLVDEAGDCEDSAILYASLIRTLGAGARLAAVDTNGDGNTDHMVVLVPVDQAYCDTFPNGSRSFWEYDGEIFALAETASEGGYLSLGVDPWHLESRDIQKTWDVSGFDHAPKIRRYLP